jgi:hypothetical protein
MQISPFGWLAAVSRTKAAIYKDFIKILPFTGAPAHFA